MTKKQCIEITSLSYDQLSFIMYLNLSTRANEMYILYNIRQVFSESKSFFT